MARTAHRDLKTAAIFYEQAFTLDPGFSMAYSKIALYLMQQYWFFEDRSETIRTRCKQYIDKAFELDPRSSNYAFSAGETFELIWEYSKAEGYYNLAITLQPDWQNPYLYLSRVLLNRDGNIRQAREILENAILRNNSSSELARSFVVQLFRLDLCEGKYEEALRELSRFPDDLFQSPFSYIPKYQCYATVYGLMDKPELERVYYDSTRMILEKKSIEMPLDSRIYSSLGVAYAGLGWTDKAITAGMKAVELMPLGKEAWRGIFPI